MWHIEPKLYKILKNITNILMQAIKISVYLNLPVSQKLYERKNRENRK